MKAKENKALILTAIAVIALGQPAFARGGGFGGGFGAGFSGGMHGFGGMGVHGFSAGFPSSLHSSGKSEWDGEKDHSFDYQASGNRSAQEDRPNDSDKPIASQPQNSANTSGNINDNHDHDNNLTNNFNNDHSWAQSHPYEAAGAADYAWNHGAYNYGAYGYGAPYGYYGGFGFFPDFPVVIDNQTNQQPAPAATQTYESGTDNPLDQQQQAIMRTRARIFAQELVGALGQHQTTAPQVVSSAWKNSGSLPAGNAGQVANQ